MMEELTRAFALVLIIEGLAPFLLPRQWRHTMARAAMEPDRNIRIVGFVSLIGGVLLLQIL